MAKTKRVMSYFGHVIWQNAYGHYGFALKKDGTDEWFESLKDAMNAIEKLEGVTEEDLK